MIPGFPIHVKHCVNSESVHKAEASNESWCGQVIATNDRSHFISVQHALLSIGGEAKLCPDCAESIKGRLSRVVYKKQGMNVTDRLERTGRERHQDGVPYAPTMEHFGPDGMPG